MTSRLLRWITMQALGPSQFHSHTIVFSFPMASTLFLHRCQNTNLHPAPRCCSTILPLRLLHRLVLRNCVATHASVSHSKVLTWDATRSMHLASLASQPCNGMVLRKLSKESRRSKSRLAQRYRTARSGIRHWTRQPPRHSRT